MAVKEVEHMKIIDPGHEYELASIDGELPQRIKFVKRFRGVENHPGTTNQEVLRMLIDRVMRLNLEQPWNGNLEIVQHLRAALVLHEARALLRKVEKEELCPELVEVSPRDGHFKLTT